LRWSDGETFLKRGREYCAAEKKRIRDRGPAVYKGDGDMVCAFGGGIARQDPKGGGGRSLFGAKGKLRKKNQRGKKKGPRKGGRVAKDGHFLSYPCLNT